MTIGDVTRKIAISLHMSNGGNLVQCCTVLVEIALRLYWVTVKFTGKLTFVRASSSHATLCTGHFCAGPKPANRLLVESSASLWGTSQERSGDHRERMGSH